MEERQAIELKSAYDFIGLRQIYNICDDYLNRSAAEKNLSGPAEFTPGQWQNRLLELSFQLFRNTRILYKKDSKHIYDRAIVLSVYIYIYRVLCKEYNKLIYLSDFSLLIGIHENTIMSWDDISYIYNPALYIDNDSNSRKEKNTNISNIYGAGNDHGASVNATPALVCLSKLIQSDAERTLTDTMIIDKTHPLKYLSILNHRHGWNRSDDTETAAKQLTLAEMRQTLGLLSASDGQSAQKSNRKKDKQQIKGKVLEK